MDNPSTFRTKETMRRATTEDRYRIEEWLKDPEDCRMAIGRYPFNKEDFLQWIHAEDQFSWMLEDDTGPVGYGEIWMDHDAKDVELAHIIIHAEHRGKGFGKMITTLLYQKAVEFGFEWVYMRVFPENKTALACYQSAAFSVVEDLQPQLSPEWIWLRRACQESSPQPGSIKVL